jgi:tripeptidyl-peptidase-2
MNGTSMAAPHVAGAIALLISGLKEKGLGYTPYSIKRALWNSATKLGYVDPFAQGNGLLNVEKAFEYLAQYSTEMETNVRFSISVGANNAKGIHIRERLLKKSKEFNVSIEPVFFNEKETPPKDKINFNMRLTLVPSETWVQCGAFLDLCYQSRTIVVSVDPTGLTPGVHSATIKAYDTKTIDKGILFEIPITVVQPEVQLNETSNIFFSGNPIICKPNTIIRKFLLVPNNATYAILRMISTDSENHTGGKFLVHTMQIIPQKFCKALETQKILPVSNDIETVHAFKCEGNNILEICIAKFWSNFGDISIKFSIEFHGIYTNGGTVMHSASGIHRLDLNTNTAQEISPSINLKNAVIALKPADSKISSLTERDVVPPCRQIYQNIFTYNFHLSKSFEVSLHAPVFSCVLYESEFESQFWMMFDTNKMMVGCGDAYSNSNFIKLEKGDYVVKLQVRHEKKDLLEKISEATMLVNLKLSSSISLDIYPSYNQAMIQGKKMSPFKMCARTSKPIYVVPLSNEKMTKAGIPSNCSWLDGTITYSKDEISRKSDCSNFQYILYDAPSTKKSNGNTSSSTNGSGATGAGSNPTKETKSKLDEYKEGLRDFQVGMIAKLDRKNAEEIYDEIIASHPAHLQAHSAMIQQLDANDLKSSLPFAFRKSILVQLPDKKDKVIEVRDNLVRISELAEKIINETDKDNILAFYGVKLDTRSDAIKIKGNIDKQKNLLLEAYVKRAIALCKISIIDKELLKEIDYTELTNDLEKIYVEIGKYIDYTDLKVSLFSIWHGYTYSQYGRMTKYLIKNYEDKLQKEYLDELADVTAERKWKHISEAIDKATVTFNPITHSPF